MIDSIARCARSITVPAGVSVITSYSIHYTKLYEHAHSLAADDAAQALGAPRRGLTREEAARRLARFGHNTLPRAQPPSLAAIFLRQFGSPLMLILLSYNFV